MGRYSMHGLEMYGSDDLGFMSGQDLQNALMAAGAGGLGILATSWVLGKVRDFQAPAEGAAALTADQEMMNSRIRSLLGVAIGVVGGKMIDQYYSRDYAMGFTGAVAGASLASLFASWAPDTFPSVALNGYSGGYMNGLADADLAALEATVATNAGAWRAPASLGAPVVDSQMLRGTMTSTEEIAAYSHLMDQQAAPPPSF